MMTVAGGDTDHTMRGLPDRDYTLMHNSLRW
jgi:hypothetical protein